VPLVLARLLFLGWFFVLMHCSSGPYIIQPAFHVKSADEAKLLEDLAMYLPADTSRQEDKDQQILINFILQKGWELNRSKSGLFFQVISPGIGNKPGWGDRVSVHYNGYFLNGTKFDSSYDRNEPFEFYIGNVIQGWNEGLTYLKPTGRALLLIPSILAYGPEGFQEIVGPNQCLAFEIELLAIKS